MERTRSTQRERYPPIGAYAAIGDCHTAALISTEGSIDWYCPTRFDGPALFCRLLDSRKGGFLRLAPEGHFSAQRHYRGPTNVLETTFTAGAGRVRVTDLMPVHRRQQARRGYDVGSARQILRLVEGVAGDVDLELSFKPTFDYARATPTVGASEGQGVVAHAGRRFVTVACPGVALEPDGAGVWRGRVRARAGERLWILLADADSEDAAREALAPADCDAQLVSTLDYWERWAAACTYRGPYREEVVRSALVLKLLMYEPTGAFVAAPTTSLPEQIGGTRNWDYRFSWLRDSSLILYALLSVGYDDEGADFFHWLVRTCGKSSPAGVQIMYGVDGRRDLPETILDHLEGYRGSRPARIGNAAADQRQLDVYGEVLTAAYLHFHREGSTRPALFGNTTTAETEPLSSGMWTLLSALVEHAAAAWREPDQGIWEVRGAPQHFLHSKLMCWAALDRGLKLADEHRLDAPRERWQRTRQEIRRAILEQGYDEQQRAFTQAFGNAALDASTLVIPRLGFLPTTDPRVLSTVECIREALTHDGLVYRYLADDGLPGHEATFALCTFWLVDALALGGRLEQARELFERVVGYANDVGLLAEEIDPSTGLLLGNFPQGFSHMALIDSAVNLAKAAKHGAEEQPETEADRVHRAGRAAAEGYPAMNP